MALVQPGILAPTHAGCEIRNRRSRAASGSSSTIKGGNASCMPRHSRCGRQACTPAAAEIPFMNPGRAKSRLKAQISLGNQLLLRMSDSQNCNPRLAPSDKLFKGVP